MDADPRMPRFGTTFKLQIFLTISTCFLYLVAAGQSFLLAGKGSLELTSDAGLFSKAVWAFEIHAWSKITGGDAAETGSGPGSYNIKQSVWHVNCCNPEINGGGGWGIFNSILGWTNSATYGSVISYNLYWLVVIVVFLSMRFYEKRGRWPLMKAKACDGESESAEKSGSKGENSLQSSLEGKDQTTVTTTNARDIES